MEERVLVNSLIKERTITKKDIYLFIKRIFDILAGIIGCVLLIPILLIVKICYIISGDYNKIIFKQERIGKNGKLFKFYKIRTMVVDADKVLQDLIKNDEQIALEYSKYKKLHNDPRVTKMGKILRKTSIDEFPQFINVLKGNMSLIGPRPYLPRELKDLGKSYDEIITCKPGLTGYWQVNGRSNTDFNERIDLDKKYIKIQGFKTDISIFFKTFIKIFKKEGAK